MVVVALADIHGDLGPLGMIGRDLSAADLVLLVGDLTEFGRHAEASRIIKMVRKYKDRVFAVPGNCDDSEVDAYLTREGINLHGRCAVIDGVAFLGLGGSLPCPGRTPNEYTEGQFEGFLAAATQMVHPQDPLVPY